MVIHSLNVDSNPILVIHASHSLLVFRDPFLESPTGFTHVDPIAILARDLIDYAHFLLFRDPVLDSNQGVSDGSDWPEHWFDLKEVV